jgi:polysaccharide export outer membrane protein
LDPAVPRALDTEARATQQEYVIGSSDVLQINVWRQPELTLDSVVVRTDGKISFPLLDDVEAAGKTPTELKTYITGRLEDYVTAPNVTVVVTQINSKMVFVVGEVVREGAIPLRAEMRVVDALSAAGGLAPFADKNLVKVIRNRDSEPPVEFVFDYDSFERGRNLEHNILLLPGDRIVVPEETPFWR